MAITLFKPPTTLEAVKPYAYGGGTRRSSGAFGGLGATSNFVSQTLDSYFTGAAGLLNSVATSATGLIDTVTGAKASRDAQANAIELAKLQAQAVAQANTERTKLYSEVGPYVAIGGVVVAGLLVLALMKKK
jgi:hypothetical protein